MSTNENQQLSSIQQVQDTQQLSNVSKNLSLTRSGGGGVGGDAIRTEIKKKMTMEWRRRALNHNLTLGTQTTRVDYGDDCENLTFHLRPDVSGYSATTRVSVLQTQQALAKHQVVLRDDFTIKYQDSKTDRRFSKIS